LLGRVVGEPQILVGGRDDQGLPADGTAPLPQKGQQTEARDALP
jgi:hypothetical protein